MRSSPAAASPRVAGSDGGRDLQDQQDQPCRGGGPKPWACRHCSSAGDGGPRDDASGAAHAMPCTVAQACNAASKSESWSGGPRRACGGAGGGGGPPAGAPQTPAQPLRPSTASSAVMAVVVRVWTIVDLPGWMAHMRVLHAHGTAGRPRLVRESVASRHVVHLPLRAARWRTPPRSAQGLQPRGHRALQAICPDRAEGQAGRTCQFSTIAGATPALTSATSAGNEASTAVRKRAANAALLAW